MSKLRSTQSPIARSLIHLVSHPCTSQFTSYTMTGPIVGITITLVPATNSVVFETRRLLVLHDRPIWLGLADENRSRSPTPTNGWFTSSTLDEKNAMLYLCWNEVWIANLHPQNTTMVNSTKLLQPEALKIGDIIRLGVPADWDTVSPPEAHSIYAEVADITRL